MENVLISVAYNKWHPRSVRYCISSLSPVSFEQASAEPRLQSSAATIGSVGASHRGLALFAALIKALLLK